MARIRLRLLGGVVVETDGSGTALRGSQAREVLAHLALERPAPVSRDALAEVLWPDEAPAHWAGALRGVVARVRRFLLECGTAGTGGDPLVYEQGAYRLDLDPAVEIDVERARASLDVAERDLGDGRAGTALAAARDAADALRPLLLAGDASAWLDRHRDRLRFQRIRALHIVSIAGAACGRPALSIEASEEALGLDPLDEVSHQAAMAAHLAAGSTAGALRAYERCRRTLVEHLGCGPGPGVDALYRRILQAEQAETETERTDGARVEAATRALLTAARTAAPPWSDEEARGEAARQACDYDSAASHFARALHQASQGSPTERARLHLRQGAALRRSGHVAQARSVLRTALLIAREAGDATSVAMIVLELVGGGGRGVSPDLDDAARAELLSEALGGLGAGPMGLRVQVLAELSLALTFVEPERSLLLATAAEDLAEASGHPSDRARAMIATRLSHMVPSEAPRRLAAIDAVLTAPDNELTSEMLVRMILWRVCDHAEMGDRAAFDRDLGVLQELTEELGQPYWRWIAAGWATTQAVFDEDLERAAALADEGLALMAHADHPEVIDAWAAHVMGIRLLQGRGIEAKAHLEARVAARPEISSYRGGLALVLAQGGLRDDAVAVLVQFQGPDAVVVQRDTNWAGTMAALAAAAHLTAHRPAAEQLISALEPHADRMAVMSVYGGGAMYLGPFALHLGRLAALVGRDDDADRWLVAAADRAEAMGSVGLADQARTAHEQLGRPSP